MYYNVHLKLPYFNDPDYLKSVMNDLKIRSGASKFDISALEYQFIGVDIDNKQLLDVYNEQLLNILQSPFVEKVRNSLAHDSERIIIEI